MTFLLVFHGRWKLALLNHMTPPIGAFKLLESWPGTLSTSAPLPVATFQQILIPLSSIIHSSCPQASLCSSIVQLLSLPLPFRVEQLLPKSLLRNKATTRTERFQMRPCKTLCIESHRTRRGACVGLILAPGIPSPSVKMGKLR